MGSFVQPQKTCLHFTDMPCTFYCLLISWLLSLHALFYSWAEPIFWQRYKWRLKLFSGTHVWRWNGMKVQWWWLIGGTKHWDWHKLYTDGEDGYWLWMMKSAESRIDRDGFYCNCCPQTCMCEIYLSLYWLLNKASIGSLCMWPNPSFFCAFV